MKSPWTLLAIFILLPIAVGFCLCRDRIVESEPYILPKSESGQTEAVATNRTRKRSVGFYLSRWSRGRRIEYDGTWPHFRRPTPLDREVERTLEAQIKAEADEACHDPWDDWDDLYETFRNVGGNHWRVSSGWRIEYHSERLISLVCGHYSYHGQAHGMNSNETLTLWWKDGQSVKLHLQDFFLPDTEWDERLRDYCVAKFIKHLNSCNINPEGGLRS